MCGGDPPPPSAKDKAQIDKFNEELEAKKDDFKNGPISNRNCTDIFCCLAFFIGILGFVGATIYGIKKGDPK